MGLRWLSVCCALSLIPLAASAADRDRLLYHAETLNGQVVSSRGADHLFNPASVVKVGTAMWALERLGAPYRYQTVVGFTGSWQREAGVVDGSLVVAGAGDPDFQVENGFLLARALEQAGVKRVSGDLVVTGSFWLGWEQGTVRRIADLEARSLLMGARLRSALDPQRWDATTRNCWQAMCRRRGWDESIRPTVTVDGGIRWAAAVEHTPLVRHLSNPLPALLRRFNVYSNNDILRVAEGLGGTAGLQSYLRSRLGPGGEQVVLETASGEGTNRMSARLAVRLMRQLHEVLGARQLVPRDLLPVPGCDPGPAGRNYPALGRDPLAGSLAVKTGTLTTTDGGVAVLAGSFMSAQGEVVLFCVAAERAGSRLRQWRALEQSWLLDLIQSVGGARAASCNGPLPFSDTGAEVEAVLQSALGLD